MTTVLDLRSFEGKATTIYEAVILASKRARKIHESITEELRKELGEIENEEDLEEESVDRERIVKEYDKREKPTIIAVKELLEGKLHKVTEGE